MNPLDTFYNDQLLTEVKKAYVEMSSNHPTIHSNRFPNWDEISKEAQQELIETYLKKGTLL